MTTALEDLNDLHKGALDELNKKVRAANKQLSEATTATIKLRAELDGLVKEVEALREEKAGLTKELAEKRHAADTYRNDQLAKIEASAAKLGEAEQRLRKAETEAASREQKAQVALAKYQELVGKVASSTGVLRKGIVEAVDKAIADLAPPV